MHYFSGMSSDDILPAGKPVNTTPQFQPDHRLRILVVEDDVDIRRINAQVLMQAGYHVDAAKDGAVAWDVLQLGNYDLLITDNAMPELTGIELLRRIHAANLRLPVIMASGNLPTWEFSVYPWLQPAAVLLKPYHVKELLAAVQNVLSTTLNVQTKMAAPDWQSYPPDRGFRL